ncbi:MAG: cytochrome P450 [Acidobacteriaceae bacterium]|nr:cytochrome P450 [Acidobacteriaceae bacterium]
MKVPPGPKGREAFGFFGGGSFAGTLEFLQRTARRYGPISSFRLLHKRIYLVDDADLVRDILVTQQHKFERDSGAGLLRELVGDALITREEPQHRDRRRVLQPAFHRDQVASYAQIMTAEAARLAEEWQPLETIDVRDQMRRLTLAIVGAALFGADFRESAAQVADVLRRVASKSRWLAPAFAFIEPAAALYRRLFPNGRSLFFESERKQLDRIVAPIVDRRHGSGTKDVVSLLLNTRDPADEPLSARAVQNEVVTFVLAGHETTATALTWTWFLLARNRHVATRLGEELHRVLAMDRPPTLEDVPELKYTGLVFQEAMRLYPPALAFARRAKEAVQLAGYTIPRHASVFLSPYVTQRNPKYFPNPEEFIPERWLEHQQPPKFAYFPFGGGAKMCIGEPFARLEGVLALATLARKWELECIDDDPVGLGTGLLLNPDRPILMRIRSRSTQVFQQSSPQPYTIEVQ